MPAANMFMLWMLGAEMERSGALALPEVLLPTESDGN
jgi:hypothetical protein